MGLDETNLHVLMASGTPTEQVHAETVYKLLSRGKHWVLGKDYLLLEKKKIALFALFCFFIVPWRGTYMIESKGSKRVQKRAKGV